MGEYNLRRYILNEKEADKTILTAIAKAAGYASTSALSKNFSKPYSETSNFNQLLSMIEAVFPNEVQAAMSSHAKNDLDFNKKTARYMLEYAKLNKLDDLFEFLLEELSNCKNKESKEWAKIYDIDNKVAKGELSNLESIDKTSNINFNSNEMSVFAKIVQIYAHNELGNYTMMSELANVAMQNIESITDEYIKKSYITRLGVVLTSTHLHMGNIEKSRSYADQVLNNTNSKSLLSLAHLHLGHSYIFESYDNSLSQLNRALSNSKELNHTRISREIERSMNFLNNYWGKKPEYLDYDSVENTDKQEVIFYLIREGKHDQALELLIALWDDSISDEDKGFYYFMKGLMTNNKEDYYVSITHFKETGDKFFRNAPLIELKKLGENEFLLNALSV